MNTPTIDGENTSGGERPAGKAVSRRSVLGWSLAAVLGAGLSGSSRDDGLDAVRAAALAQNAVVWAVLTRPKDQLALRWELLNFQLLKAGDAGPGDQASARLTIVDPSQPAFLVVHFQPQNVAERAYFEVDPKLPGQAGDETDQLTTPTPAAVAGETRLAFRVPWDTAPIPFTPEALLNWQDFAMSVVPAAAHSVTGRPGPQSPLNSQTGIEAPWGLVLSPDENAGWAHSIGPVTHGTRTELWHTRLGVRRADEHSHYSVDEQDARNRAVRAVWAAGFNPNIPPTSGSLGPTPPGRTSLTPRHRHEIVRLSSDYSMNTGNSDGANPVPYQPKPIAVNRLMLSTLGAWVDADGSWDTPVRPVGAREYLTVQQWLHKASMGRDHYVKVVQAGFLFPFGHRASLVIVTEREFQPVAAPRMHPQMGKLGAFSRQRMFLVVREPERAYGDGLPFQPYRGRAMPLKKVRITTQTTPNLAPADGTTPEPLTKVLRKPGDQASFFGTDAFWPVVASAAGPQDFQFVLEGEDALGQRCHFTAPLIFVKGSISDSRTAAEQIIQQYGAAAAPRRERPTGGARLAMTNLDGESTYPVDSITLGASLPSGPDEVLDYRRQPRFFPSVSSASIRLDSVERVTGKPAGTGSTPITWHDGYLKGIPNPGNIFAMLPNPIDLVFAADTAGAMITPNISIGGLSSLIGPIGGDLTAGLPTSFDPAAFFSGATMPRILGALELPSIIVKAAFSALDRIPKLLSTQLPDAVETSYTWNPVVKADDDQIFVPSNPATTLVVRAKATVRRSGGAPTFEVVGELTDFVINAVGTGALGLLTIKFKRLRFTVRDGRKATVDVDITGVTFNGALSFINPLQEFLASTGLVPGLGKKAKAALAAAPSTPPPNGPDISVTAAGIRAGYTLAVPKVAVGVFSLENIVLSSVLNIPFIGDPARVRFAFAERERPFLLTVAMFGGGGFCALQLGLDGFERFEAALEFGAKLSLDLGVASGGVSAMAGLYFALTPTDGTLTGYLRLNGELSILGLVSLGLEFYLGMALNPGTGEVSGEARLTVSISIAFFSTSVTLGPIEKRFGGGKPQTAAVAKTGRSAAAVAPPAVPDLMSEADWADPATGYCAMFAPAAFT